MSKNLSDIFPPTEIGGGGGGIEEAPKTGKMYARKDAAWEEFATANLDDGNQDGEILTWDTATANWTHYDGLIVGKSRLFDFKARDAGYIRMYQESDVCYFMSYGDGSVPAISFRSSDGGTATERMRIDASGRAGIGTDPAFDLDVRGSDPTIQARATNAGGTATLNLYGLASNRSDIAVTQIKGVPEGDTPASSLTFSTRNSIATTTERMRIDASGNVGIGTTSPSAGAVGGKVLHVQNSGATASVRVDRSDAATAGTLSITSGNTLNGVYSTGAKDLTISTNSAERMRIDSSGRVGIGIDSPTLARLEVVADSTENRVARFVKTNTSTSNNTYAVEIDNTAQTSNGTTSGALLVECFNGPALIVAGSGRVGLGGTPGSGTGEIGGGTAKLQVAGDGYFSGTVNATTINGKVTDVPDHVKAITPTQIANWDAGTGGGATTDGRISDTQIVHWDQAYSWGDHKSANYQPAGNYETAGTAYTKAQSDSRYQPAGNYLTPSSLNGYATESWVTSNYQAKGNYETAGTAYTKAESDAKYELKGAGGLPAGDWHCTGSITATGNITAYAASDERLKDDIGPMPIGLIDGIAPATFKWKDSGKSSGGVIAQQLQACGLEDWVNEAPNGDLGVDYNALIGVLLAEVQDLKSRVKELEGAY
jgi:hypothetical protein